MQHRNKLGVFSFDDDVQPSHMKLIVANVMGQYFNPKPGQPRLTDENSCYNYIAEYCGMVLAAVPFSLEIREEVRHAQERDLLSILSEQFDMAAVVLTRFAENVAKAFASV